MLTTTKNVEPNSYLYVYIVHTFLSIVQYILHIYVVCIT